MTRRLLSLSATVAFLLACSVSTPVPPSRHPPVYAVRYEPPPQTAVHRVGRMIRKLQPAERPGWLWVAP